MPKDAVLLVIDVQRGFRHSEYWGIGGNPEALNNIEQLVTHWRSKNLPIVVVKHNSKSPDSPLFAGADGNALEPFLDGPKETIIQKSVNSAFYGTPDLHLWLSKRSFRNLVICGITTNFCCETTARMAGNLGYDTSFVLDATDAFPQRDLDGNEVSAADVMRISAANLNGEFAKVISTKQALETF